MNAASAPAALPPGFETPLEPARFEQLLQHLAAARRQLSALSADAIWEAWRGTLGEFLDPISAVRRRIDPSLGVACRLSESGLDGAFDAIAAGLLEPEAEERFRAASARPAPERDPPPVALAVLSGNIPGLAVQSLLPALATRRPLLIKTARTEPYSAPAIVAELGRRLAPLAAGYAALWWPGGHSPLDELAHTHCAPVLAYGRESTLESIRRRAGERLVAHGPRLSIAVLDMVPDGSLDHWIAMGLARDIALFDQRGCLSVQLVFTAGPAERCAAPLANALAELAAGELVPGPATPAETAAVRLALEEATLRGAPVWGTPETGLVLVESEATLTLPPGRRCVRLVAVDDLERVPEIVRSLGVSLQGAALAGARVWSLCPRLEALGCSRITTPGQLQRTGVEWNNGGVDLFDLFAQGASPETATPASPG